MKQGSPGKRIVLRGMFKAFSPSEQGFSPAAHGEFRQLRPGVHILPLYGKSEDGSLSSAPSAAFLRYEPGASIPEHDHPGYEHILVLSGSQRDQSGHYTTGTCLISPPGTRHSVQSDDGCLVLAIWNRPVVLLEGESS